MSAPKPPTPEYMSSAHSMDYTILHCGHPAVSQHVVTLADMSVTVHGLDEIKGSSLPVAIILLAHGFAGNAKNMAPMATGLLGEIGRFAKESERVAGGGKKARDVIVATFDQRNHGDRAKIEYPPFDTDPMRLIVMASLIAGGVSDHQYVMDLLPSALFPQDDRKVVEFMSAGVSMGGHVTWRLLRDDPRVRTGAPLIALPPTALLSLLTARAPKLRQQGIATYLPSDMAAFYASPSASSFAGKKVLSVHGKLDRVVPVRFAMPAVDKLLEGGGGGVEVVVEEGAGHVVTCKMVGRVGEWFWVHGVRG